MYAPTPSPSPSMSVGLVVRATGTAVTDLLGPWSPRLTGDQAEYWLDYVTYFSSNRHWMGVVETAYRLLLLHVCRGLTTNFLYNKTNIHIVM